jgi:hypothetical protein
MTQAIPQRIVNVSILGKKADGAQALYSYWSPNEGYTRTAMPNCELYQKRATNTLFVLDYASTLNGWTIVGTESNPPDAPSLETISGPANMSIMTMFPALSKPSDFKFYIVYFNTLTGENIRFDPQEKNVPEA